MWQWFNTFHRLQSSSFLSAARHHTSPLHLFLVSVSSSAHGEQPSAGDSSRCEKNKTRFNTQGHLCHISVTEYQVKLFCTKLVDGLIDGWQATQRSYRLHLEAKINHMSNQDSLEVISVHSWCSLMGWLKELRERFEQKKTKRMLVYCEILFKKLIWADIFHL